MRIQNYDDALDFLPTDGIPRLQRARAFIRDAVRALNDGVDAVRTYERLTGRGVAPADAARMAMRLPPAPKA